MTRTVDSLFRAAVERAPDRVFMRAIGHAPVTYGEAQRPIAGLVAALRGRGLATGARVVGYLDDMMSSICFNLACAHAGVIPVAIGPPYSADAALRLAAEVEAGAVFSWAEQAAALVARGTPPICFRFPGRTPPPEGAEVIEPDAMARDDARRLLAESARDHGPDSVYSFQPTSGTTGAFKLAMRQHHVFARAARIFAEGLRPGAEPPERLLMISALTHGLGQYLLATGLYLGAEFCLASDIDTRCPIEDVHALRPTYLGVTPRVLRSLHRQHLERIDPTGEAPLLGPDASTLLIGGSAPDPELLRLCTRQGVNVIEGLASSETGPIAFTERGHWREGLVGKVLPDVEIRIEEDGELLVRSPEGLMLGYYANEELTRQSFTADGFYRTGDRCEITPDGYFRYLGRKRDVFNTADGSNIYPARIEVMIEGLPWVHQAVLIGDQRPYLAALIVPREVPPGAELAADDGHLPEAAHEALYARAKADLGRINQGLETNERIRRFALLGRPMDDTCYTVVGHGKASRKRDAIAARYGARIAALYGDAALADASVPDA
jgi:long-chain acyl-CoA synthetase